MTPDERRWVRLTKALEDAQVKLAATKPEDYRREVDYQRVLTARQNKVAGLEKLLVEGNEDETGGR